MGVLGFLMARMNQISMILNRIRIRLQISTICGQWMAVIQSLLVMDSVVQVITKSWVTKEADVSQFGGQAIKLRFSFFSDPLLEADGWYLDDVGLYVDWFEEQGTWTSDLIDTSRNGLGTIDVDATVPNGTWVRCSLIGENGATLQGMGNLSFPVIPLPGSLSEKVRIKLEVGTTEPELTPKIHALYVGGTNIFSAKDASNGWEISPYLDLNQTSGNLTNSGLSTHSVTGPLIYANSPMEVFDLSGVGAGVLVTLLDERGVSFNYGSLGNKNSSKDNTSNGISDSI